VNGQALNGELVFDLPSGRLVGRSVGALDAPLVLCIPGLTGNRRVFDPILEHLGGARHRVVALDLRGRGHSERTPAGTYGWDAHARDVLAVATVLGARAFDMIGHSMGAYVTMEVAAVAPERLRRAVLVDAAGSPEPSSLPPIYAGVERLGVVQPTLDAYLERIRALGTVEPWNDQWRAVYEYECEPAPGGGVVSRTSRAAVEEDMRYGAGHPTSAMWPALTMPALLVRATRPVLPQAGFIVPADEYQRFMETVPGGRGVEVDANHYAVIMDAATITAIEEFLG
jgi:pimeloyl-ACP methyl ester carboxylesterase